MPFIHASYLSSNDLFWASQTDSPAHRVIIKNAMTMLTLFHFFDSNLTLTFNNSVFLAQSVCMGYVWF